MCIMSQVLRYYLWKAFQVLSNKNRYLYQGNYKNYMSNVKLQSLVSYEFKQELSCSNFAEIALLQGLLTYSMLARSVCKNTEFIHFHAPALDALKLCDTSVLLIQPAS